jgi:hypothetical protein
MGRHCGGIFGVNWREATYTKKAVAVTVQPKVYLGRALSAWLNVSLFDLHINSLNWPPLMGIE